MHAPIALLTRNRIVDQTDAVSASATRIVCAHASPIVVNDMRPPRKSPSEQAEPSVAAAPAIKQDAAGRSIKPAAIPSTKPAWNSGKNNPSVRGKENSAHDSHAPLPARGPLSSKISAPMSGPRRPLLSTSQGDLDLHQLGHQFSHHHTDEIPGCPVISLEHLQ